MYVERIKNMYYPYFLTKISINIVVFALSMIIHHLFININFVIHAIL